MLHLFRNLGVALAGTALVSMVSLTPAAAWGGYGGNSYGSMHSYGSMPNYGSSQGYSSGSYGSYGMSQYGNSYGHAARVRVFFYWVHFGDTLSRIAARFHTSVGALLAANPRIHDPDLIFAGMVLRIPSYSSSYGASYGGYGMSGGYGGSTYGGY